MFLVYLLGNPPAKVFFGISRSGDLIKDNEREYPNLSVSPSGELLKVSLLEDYPCLFLWKQNVVFSLAFILGDNGHQYI